MAIRLGPNQYGKAEVRVVAVDRSAPRHTLVDLDVSSSLRGDFTAAHTAGDNAHVLATDTQKNTVFAFARDGVGSPRAFALRLARHFAGAYDWITGAPPPCRTGPGRAGSPCGALLHVEHPGRRRPRHEWVAQLPL